MFGSNFTLKEAISKGNGAMFLTLVVLSALFFLRLGEAKSLDLIFIENGVAQDKLALASFVFTLCLAIIVIAVMSVFFTLMKITACLVTNIKAKNWLFETSHLAIIILYCVFNIFAVFSAFTEPVQFNAILLYCSVVGYCVLLLSEKFCRPLSNVFTKTSSVRTKEE